MKKVRRKGSKVIWEVWHEDKDIVSLMQYNRTRPNARLVKRSVFNKYWEIVT